MNLDVRWAQIDFALAADGPGRAAHACGAFTHVAPAVDALVADDCAIGAWFLRNVNSSGSASLVFVYGPPNLTPIAGDWNGL